MSETAQRISNLPPAKLALFLERLKKKAQDGAQIPALQRTGEGDCFPLSHAQQRLWLLHQLEPETPLFNVPGAWRLQGRLDAEALRAALTEVSRRHESLRTSFVIKERQPVQMVSPPREAELPLVDLTGLTEREQRREALRIGGEWTRRPFDLGRGPLLRACLLKFGEESHGLLLAMHHIITDGWSMGVLVRELSVLYDAYRRGESSTLPELEVQYGDYAVWQRERLQAGTFARQLSYWKKQLAGAPDILELSAQQTPPAERTRSGGNSFITLTAELTEQIRALNRREGVTLYMTLLAAFQALLCRYSGQEDICVGSPLAGRNSRQTEAIIGFFINTLVLRTDLSGNPSFRGLLARVRDTCLAAHAHQDVPFESLVAELKPDRSLGQTPFFQVWFALQNTRQETLRMAGLTLSPMPNGVKTAQFDLTLIAREDREHINAFLNYNADIFGAEAAAQILKDYETLLREATARPDLGILDIPLGHADPAADDGAALREAEEEAEAEFSF